MERRISMNVRIKGRQQIQTFFTSFAFVHVESDASNSNSSISRIHFRSTTWSHAISTCALTGNRLDYGGTWICSNHLTERKFSIPACFFSLRYVASLRKHFILICNWANVIKADEDGPVDVTSVREEFSPDNWNCSTSRKLFSGRLEFALWKLQTPKERNFSSLKCSVCRLRCVRIWIRLRLVRSARFKWKLNGVEIRRARWEKPTEISPCTEPEASDREGSASASAHSKASASAAKEAYVKLCICSLYRVIFIIFFYRSLA